MLKSLKSPPLAQRNPWKMADLVKELAGACGRRSHGPGPSAGSVSPHHKKFPDLTVADALLQLLPSPTMPDHEADSDLEVFLPGFLGHCKHLPAGGAVHGHGLFHEHVQTALDGLLQMHPSKRR